MNLPISVSFCLNLSNSLPYIFMAIAPLCETVLCTVVFTMFIKNSVPLDEKCYVNANSNDAEM